MELILGFVIGLIVGWNLPQPQWAKTVTDKIVTKVKDLFKKEA